MIGSEFLEGSYWERGGDLVTFKRWDGVKDENFQYYGGSLKNPIFEGWGSQKTNIYGRTV